MDVMIDMETLATGNDAVILTIGAVKFDPFNLLEPSAPFYVKVNVDEQVALGRNISESTLDWWSKQAEDVREEALSDANRIPLEDVVTQLNKYLSGSSKIWAQGVMFDIGILENLYQSMGRPVPWQYWQIRDSRTVMDMGDDSAKTSNAALHNALADAYAQAVSVQQIFKQLGVKAKGRK